MIKVFFLLLAYIFPSFNETELNFACEIEQKKIPQLIEFWKQKDKEISDANDEIEKKYQDNVLKFYRGELNYAPGIQGPVGFNWGFHIQRTVVHHTATYFDSNHKKEILFNVFPDGRCSRK
jgi:hypothetical protein